MVSQKLCKHYLKSKCLLGGVYCDLSCDRVRGGDDPELYDVSRQWRVTLQSDSHYSKRNMVRASK